LQVGDTGPVESARRSNSRVLGSPFSGLSGQWGSPAKSCLILFLTMFIRNVFKRISQFLANLYYTIKKYTHCVLNDPKICLFYFLAYEYPKNANNFTLVSNPFK
jgi:hypothetical protein